MIKARPAVVISPRLPHRNWLCTVVPLSGDANEYPSAWDIQIDFDPPLPYPFLNPVAWAKCDMLATVGFDRLDLFRTDRDQYGKRKYLHPKVSEVDLARIRTGVLFALGLGNLTLTKE
jgi:mRNA interferase MazF